MEVLATHACSIADGQFFGFEKKPAATHVTPPEREPAQRKELAITVPAGHSSL